MIPSIACVGNDRMMRSSSTPIKTGTWSPDEDALLTAIVRQHGPRRWSLISTGIPGRTGKSCRLRWCNQLSPDVHHRPFTRQEDALILAAHARYGNKWATIARLLPGSTDNSVKNHWNSNLRKCQRRARAAAAAAATSSSAASNTAAEKMQEHIVLVDVDDDDDDSGKDEPPAKRRQCVTNEAAAAGDDPPPIASLTLLPQLPVDGHQTRRPRHQRRRPWVMAVMRRMVREEVQRQLLYSLLVAAKAGGASASDRPSNGHH